MTVNCGPPDAVASGHDPAGIEQSASTGVTVRGAAEVLKRDL